MKSTTNPVKVCFRKFHDQSDVIALFPEIPSDNRKAHCLSYELIGEHGSASVDMSHCTSLASRAEYAETKIALENRGYVLQVVSRVTPAMHRKRAQAMITIGFVVEDAVKI